MRDLEKKIKNNKLGKGKARQGRKDGQNRPFSGTRKTCDHHIVAKEGVCCDDFCIVWYRCLHFTKEGGKKMGLHIAH